MHSIQLYAHQSAADNLLQMQRRPNWYDHLGKVEAAMAASDRIYAARTAAGWELDDGGWYGPHPETGELVHESVFEDEGWPLPQEVTP